MTENILLYTYCTKVCEHYDLSYEEMHALVQNELKKASITKNVILTGKGDGGRDFFGAFACKKLTKDFLWVHCCSHNMLGLDIDEPYEKKYYVLTFTACAKSGIHI